MPNPPPSAGDGPQSALWHDSCTGGDSVALTAAIVAAFAARSADTVTESGPASKFTPSADTVAEAGPASKFVAPSADTVAACLEAALQDSTARVRWALEEERLCEPLPPSLLRLRGDETVAALLRSSDLARHALLEAPELDHPPAGYAAPGWAAARLEAVIDEVALSTACGALARIHRAAAALPPTSAWRTQPALHWERLAAYCGHPTHPMAKLKHPLSGADVLRFCPEFAPSVGIELAAVATAALRVSTTTGLGLSAYVAQHYPAAHAAWESACAAQGLDSAAYAPLPVHPCQVETALRLHEALAAEGGLVVLDARPRLFASPLLSFRTLRPEGSAGPDIKLPVAVQATSQFRYVSPVEAHDSPLVCAAVARMVGEAGIGGALRVLDEDLGAHVAHGDDRPSYERARHLSVLFRAQPVPGPGERAIVLAAALCGAPDEPLAAELARAAGVADAASAASFYGAWCATTLEGTLGLYARYSVVLEAHQQNTVLAVRGDGTLAGLWYRDVAGGVCASADVLAAAGHGTLAATLHPRQDYVLQGHGDFCYMHDAWEHVNLRCHLEPLADVLAVAFTATPAERSACRASMANAASDAAAAVLASARAWAAGRDPALARHVAEVETALRATDGGAARKRLLLMRMLDTKEEIVVRTASAGGALLL